MMRLEPRQPWQLRLQIRGWFEDMNINITFWYVVEIIIWGYQLFIFDICNIHLLTNWQRPQAQQVVIHAVYSFLLKTKKDIRWYQNNYLRKKKWQFKSSTSFESGETPYNILLMVRKECEVFLCTVSQSCQDSIFHMLEDNQFWPLIRL